jgi:flagellar biosynthesis component FlhA
MQIKYGLNAPSTTSGLMRKLVALIVTAAMLGLVLMFSAVLLVIIMIVGTIAGAYLWWKTRELRKQMRAFQAAQMTREKPVSADDVVEGEVIRVVESPDGK